MKNVFIETFAKWLLGGSYWARIKHMVSVVESSGLTGAQKRAQVFNDAKAIGFDLTTVLVNVGIELAVVWLRNTSGK